MLIKVENLSKSYMTLDKKEIKAFENLEFDIEEGEFVSVVGPSGCGKSSLLKILAGILPKTSGQAILQGTPIEGPRKDIGVVFQSPILLPWRTVLQNIMIPIEIQGHDIEISLKRAQSYLEMVRLDGFEDKYPWELSGGMQQRVGICRALVHDPAVLLMDEPFGALDAMTREHMNLELMRIWLESRKTILFITHSVTEAVFLANRVIVLSDRPGKIQEILNIEIPHPRTPATMTTDAFGVYTARIRRYLDAIGDLGS